MQARHNSPCPADLRSNELTTKFRFLPPLLAVGVAVCALAQDKPSPARAQCAGHNDQDLLHQAVRGIWIPQVAQSIEPDAWRHAPEQLGFRFSIFEFDSPHENAIGHLGFHQYIFNV
jgi:hypothetical protein